MRGYKKPEKTQQQLLEEERVRNEERLERARKARQQIEEKRLKEILEQPTKQMQLQLNHNKSVPLEQIIDPQAPIKYALLISNNINTGPLLNTLMNYYDVKQDRAYVYDIQSSNTYKNVILARAKKLFSRLRQQDVLIIYLDNSNEDIVQIKHETITPDELFTRSVGNVAIFSTNKFGNYKCPSLTTTFDPLCKTLQTTALASKYEPHTWGDVFLVCLHYSVGHAKIPILDKDHINTDFRL